MKIALVYDWLTTPHGGAEHVLRALHELFPTAPLYTSLYDEKKVTWARQWQVKTTFLQKIPFAKKYFRAFGPLMPLAFETLNLSEFDTIISVTSSFAKSVITQPHQRHICYLLTPNRHLYSHRAEYEQKATGPLGYCIKKILNYLYYQDQVAAQRPDVIIPISHLVAERTQRYYKRPTAPVIYPPVTLHHYPISTTKGKKYYLVVSRIVPYKQIDLTIKACQKLGRSLIIVGSGPESATLKKLASTAPSTIQFLENVSETTLDELYEKTHGLLMPGLEDFGITALEAVNRGVPVILHQASGAAEIIRDGKEGIYLKKSTLAELIKAMHTLEMTAWQPDIMAQHVTKYSTEHFQKEFEKAISSTQNYGKKERFYEQ